MKRVFAFLLLLLPASALAQTPLPDTHAGQAFGAWLSAFNASDKARMLDVIAQYHISAPPGAFMGFAHATGGFTLLRIEQSNENELTVIVAEKNSDTIAHGAITVTEDASGQITKTEVKLRGFAREGEFAIPRLNQAEALKALEDHAAEAAKSDKFSGVYLIARDGKVLAAKAFGWEDRKAKRKITLETKFRIGSMDKMFTAVAALQLVTAGELSLDGTVGTYLPDYPNPEIADKVTIRMLLTHTGGTGDFFGPEYNAHRLSLKTHADYVALFGSRGPGFAPGSRDDYSNYGFILLGRIIEKASGQDYYDYVARNIFAPAGMTSTAFLPEDVTVLRRATAYTWKDGWFRVDNLPYRGTSAGGGYTTAGDLLKFAKALQTEKLLPLRVVADATIQHDHDGDTGYGFDIGGKGLLQNFGDTGGSPGQNGMLAVYPALGQTVVVLSNFDPPAADNLASFYTNRMPAMSWPAASAAQKE